MSSLTRKCDYCGEETCGIVVTLSKDYKVFCSTKCRNYWMREQGLKALKIKHDA